VGCFVPDRPRNLDKELRHGPKLQGKNVPFSRIAVQHPTKVPPVRLIAQVPVNVSLATKMAVTMGEGDPGVAAPFCALYAGGLFRRLRPEGRRLAEVSFVVRSGQGKATFKDSGEHDISFPLSLNLKGFGPAFDALAKS
jgi:hypothetical protein